MKLCSSSFFGCLLLWCFLGFGWFLLLCFVFLSLQFQPLAKMTCAHRTHGVSTRAKKILFQQWSNLCKVNLRQCQTAFKDTWRNLGSWSEFFSLSFIDPCPCNCRSQDRLTCPLDALWINPLSVSLHPVNATLWQLPG